jgi:hypothetical protein
VDFYHGPEWGCFSKTAKASPACCREVVLGEFDVDLVQIVLRQCRLGYKDVLRSNLVGYRPGHQTKDFIDCRT